MVGAMDVMEPRGRDPVLPGGCAPPHAVVRVVVNPEAAKRNATVLVFGRESMFTV
jgi:hypothetical protein